MLQLKETPASRKTLQKFTNDKKSKKKTKKNPPEKNKCFWGDSNVTKQLLMK